jgi:DNA-binding CsgD family transcriptional regulator
MRQTDLGAAPERQSQHPALVQAATEETDLLRESVVVEFLAGAGLRSLTELADLLLRVASLTETERDVLDMLRGGRKPRAVAAVRHCAVSTVRRHLANTRAKFGCNTTSEACLLLTLAEWVTGDR